MVAWRMGLKRKVPVPLVAVGSQPKAALGARYAVSGAARHGEGTLLRPRNQLLRPTVWAGGRMNRVMEESDAAVVARVCAGDQEAFRALVQRHSRAVFRLAYRMTGNEQEAEDVVQETFLRAYRHLGRFDSGASFPAWLHRIALNYSISLRRKGRRQAAALAAGNDFSAEAVSAVPASALTPDCAAANTELQAQIQSALAQLSPQERAAFVLRHLEGRSMGEICCALGLGASAAKDSVFRAVQKLRRALRPWFNPASPEPREFRQEPGPAAFGREPGAGPNRGEQLGIAP